MAKPDMCDFNTVCRVADIPAGEARRFTVGEVSIAVFNICGEFFALANQCPHGGASLAQGLIKGDTVCCRVHHWQFSIRDGTYLDQDLPRCNVKTYPVRVVGNEIQVAVTQAG